MSILIKGMKMPKGCDECKLGDIVCGADEDHGWIECPLVEVPTPHGRLIEAPEIEWEAVGGGEKEISLGALIALAHKVDNAPTVIEAEGKNARHYNR